MPVVFIFILNALVFVPLGNLIGSYLCQMPPLRAYAWDIGGAITGTVCFGLFSYFWFNPVVGLILVMVAFLFYCRHSFRWLPTALLFLLTVFIVLRGEDPRAVWSPYNHITLKEIDADGNPRPFSNIVTPIGTLKDPPIYTIQVNHDFFQTLGTIDSQNYTSVGIIPRALGKQYRLPHLIRPGAKDILVVGAASGNEVEAALLSGAERVDVVEIDPVIIWMGHRYNASEAYKSPSVSVHNTDARAFLRQTDRT